MDFVNCYEELEKAIRLSGHTFEDILFAKIERYIGNKSERYLSDKREQYLGIKNDKSLCFKLEANYSIEELKEFKKSCWNLNYDSGYGTQELHGVIVFKDNSWLERAEYDGSEWWEYKQCPVWNKEKEDIEDNFKESCELSDLENLNQHSIRNNIEGSSEDNIDIEPPYGFRRYTGDDNEDTEDLEFESLFSNIEENGETEKIPSNEPITYNLTDKEKCLEYPKNLTSEQIEKICLRDIKHKWVIEFIEASSNKQEVLKAIILKATTFKITENGWLAKIENEDKVLPYLVNDSNLHVLLEHEEAWETFKNYLLLKYSHHGEYVNYILSYLHYSSNASIEEKTKVLKTCQSPKLYLSPEFDGYYIQSELKGNILVNGAGYLVKKLAANLKCSKAEATKLIQKGKYTLEEIVREYEGKCPLSHLDWQTFRWWLNKKNSTEWLKDRIAYLPAGQKIHWKWIDRIDELKPEHIHNDKESPSIVMKRAFQETENSFKKLFENTEELKKQSDYPDCPIKGNDEFKQVKNPYELYLISKAFHNCAFTYNSALASGKTYIFTSNEACIEICEGSKKGYWFIQQCLGPNNSRLANETKKRLLKWFNEAKKAACVK